MLKVFQILLNKIRKNKIDFFLHYKYSRIKKYYGRYCLDIGTGTGRFTKFLRRRGHATTALDVIDKTKDPTLDLRLFNGRSIPFSSKKFETSILMFVLHHTDYAVELLKECIRVTSKRIIIGEDIIVTECDRIYGNIHLGTSPWSKSQNGFKTDIGWRSLFTRLNLKIVEIIEIPRSVYPVYPVLRKIYVLEVAK